jgi:hypothetical protein
MLNQLRCVIIAVVWNATDIRARRLPVTGCMLLRLLGLATPGTLLVLLAKISSTQRCMSDGCTVPADQPAVTNVGLEQHSTTYCTTCLQVACRDVAYRTTTVTIA